MNLLYSINEAFSGFSKARVPTVAAVFTIFFLLSILSIVSILSLNIYRIVTVLNANQDLQVFLANTLTPAEIEAFRKELAGTQGVVEVEYISREDAAAEFKQEFGEDIFDALDENPLPASFVIQLTDDKSVKANIELFAEKLKQMEQVDDVILHQEALNTLVKFSTVSKIIMYILFTLVFLGSLFMVSNTIRLIIIARRQIIETMKLVGATNSFIRLPIIIEGIVQGLMGGLLTFCIVFVLLNFISLQWPGLVLAPPAFYMALVSAGVLFGLVGSVFAIKRFL